MVDLPGNPVANLSEYELRHLIAHLEECGLIEKIHHLLALETISHSNAWFEVKQAYDDIQGYLEDVSRAWKDAEAGYLSADELEAAKILGLQVRYALITSSIYTLAFNTLPALVISAVKQGLYTPLQGLTFARLTPDKRQRSASLAALAFYLPPNKRIEALKEALATALEIEDANDRAWALVSLVQKLPSGEKPLALQEALFTIREIRKDYWRVKALEALAPHLLPDFLTQALIVAREFEWEYYRARALSAIIPSLSEKKQAEIIGEILSITSKIGFLGSSVEVLARIITYLPDIERTQVLQEALNRIRSCHNSEECAESLILLAPSLSPELLEQALSSARENKNGYWRAKALAGMVSFLPEDKREAVIQEALTATWEWGGSEQSDILAILAPHLSPTLLAKALEIASQDTDRFTDTLVAVSPYLPAELLKEALDIVQKLRWEESACAKALSALAPYLPSNLLAQALKIAQEIEIGEFRALALAGIAPYLSPNLLKQALSAANEVRCIVEHVDILATLAPYLSPNLVAQILPTIKKIRWDSNRAQALITLAPSLCPNLIGEALSIANKLQFPENRIKALVALVPHLPEQERVQMLCTALTDLLQVRDIDEQAMLFTALVSYLPHVMLAQAWDIAKKLPRNGSALAALIPKVPPSWLPEVQIQKFSYASECVTALIGLVPHLRESEHTQVFREAWTSAMASGDSDKPATVLAAFAPYLSFNSLEQILSIVREIDFERTRAKALAALIPHLPLNTQTEVLQELLSIAQKSRDRDELLPMFVCHLPPDLMKQAVGLAREIQFEPGRVRALIAAVPYLPTEERQQVLADALATIQEIDNARWRVEAFVKISEYLPEYEQIQILQQALNVIQDMPDDDLDKKKALSILVPHLPSNLLLDVLKVVWKIYRRNKVLALVAPRLALFSPSTLYPVWQETLRVLSINRRNDLLSDLRALLPVIYALGGKQVATEIFHAVHDVARWWP